MTAPYLPEPDDFRRLPRQWLINVAYTLIEKPFADWVHARTEARNSKLVEEQKLAIDIDPAILRAFNASTNISSKYLKTSRLNEGSKRNTCFCYSPEG